MEILERTAGQVQEMIAVKVKKVPARVREYSDIQRSIPIGAPVTPTAPFGAIFDLCTAVYTLVRDLRIADDSPAELQKKFTRLMDTSYAWNPNISVWLARHMDTPSYYGERLTNAIMARSQTQMLAIDFLLAVDTLLKNSREHITVVFADKGYPHFAPELAFLKDVPLEGITAILIRTRARNPSR